MPEYVHLSLMIRVGVAKDIKNPARKHEALNESEFYVLI